MTISELVRTFPDAEKYALTSQITRSARSVTANIAEGYGRYTYTDTRRFFIQSRGSAVETLEHLSVAHDEGYITENTLEQIEQQCETVIKTINGYIAYLDKVTKERNIQRQPNP
ncbi:four helix bundle protein [Nemorincola caseinilytica]|uniref:Four helix bundle protein n=2 Tax=Nemorincola caseinilytica TaxID=2054315 RepID=A0ABP8NHZ7_9BACT